MASKQILVVAKDTSKVCDLLHDRPRLGMVIRPAKVLFDRYGNVITKTKGKEPKVEVLTTSSHPQAQHVLKTQDGGIFAIVIDLELVDGIGFGLEKRLPGHHLIMMSEYPNYARMLSGSGRIVTESNNVGRTIERLHQRMLGTITVEPAEYSDVAGVYNVALKSWVDKERVTLEEFYERLMNFPMAIIVAKAEINGHERVLGFLSPIILNIDEVPVGWKMVTQNGTYSNHNPNGDTLICPQVGLDIDFCHLMGITGIPRLLIEFGKRMAKSLGLQMAVYTRSSGYDKAQQKYGCIPIEVYIKTCRAAYETNGNAAYRDVPELTLGMHWSFGGIATPLRVDANATTDKKNGGYCILLSYKI